MRQLFATLIVILPASLGLAGETASQQTWAKQIRGKPANSVLDNTEVIEMIAFTGREGTKIAPRSAAIASVLFRTYGVSPLSGPLEPETLRERASLLAGRKLTLAEETAVKSLSQRITANYCRVNPPDTSGKMHMDITFGLKDIRSVDNVICDADTTEKALLRILETNGWFGSYQPIESISFESLKMAIDRGMPVIMENSSHVFFCFGYACVDGQEIILLAIPEQMPLQVGRMRFAKEDEESVDPRVVNYRKNAAERTKGKFKEDYQIKTSKQIPAEGFLIEPFEKGKYTAYVLMNWKRSAAAHDMELRKLLNLPEPELEKLAEFPSQPTDKDLWNHYVLGKEETLGGPYSLVPSIVFPSGGYLNQQYACLTSSVATQKGVAVGKFTLSIRKFYRGACEVMNDDFLLLEGDKKAKVEALVESIKAQYEAKQKGIESIVEELEDPYLVAALHMKATMAPTANIEKGLADIESLHGWKALLETAQDVPFDKYQEAIHKRIPVVLKNTREDDWLLCVGYLRHNGTGMLLIVNPGMIDKSKTMHINNDRLYPGPGVYFEKFDQKKYQPYFIHDWRISVDAYKEQIAAIFADEKKGAD